MSFHRERKLCTNLSRLFTRSLARWLSRHFSVIAGFLNGALRLATDHGEFAFPLRISTCKSVASGGMRAGKQPGASLPPWSKHSGLALMTNARRRLRSRVNRFSTRLPVTYFRQSGHNISINRNYLRMNNKDLIEKSGDISNGPDLLDEEDRSVTMCPGGPDLL